eukprot:CAMPEP_0176499756 /NCGR_PEP_ID=MMETSP0200_2-20121128/13117_1 /TAXON_ID=947934 /ORGANISM="Chaetoceros sp., Strain GSL56" /LENGTH=670 /DNA_ID=CAMNT_0017898237 /DNA_START=174 /DNA_END=2186 /DNA_ORIENTATION=+
MEPERQSDPVTRTIDPSLKNIDKKRSYDEIFSDTASNTNAKRSTFITAPKAGIETTNFSLNRHPTISAQPACQSKDVKDKTQCRGLLTNIFSGHQFPRDISTKDEFICRNVEMFLPSTEDGMQARLGFRCIHCARHGRKIIDSCIIFPSSIEEMENSLHLMIERHFPKCPVLPESVKMSILGKNFNSSEKKQPKSLLKEFLVQFCKYSNIVNRDPYQTGVICPSRQSQGKVEDIQSTSYNSPSNNNYVEEYATLSRSFGGSFDHSLIDQYSTPSSQHNNYQRTTQFPNPTSQAHLQQQTRYAIPFIQTDHNTWECRFCLNQAIEARAERSVWYASFPPDPMFMENHLRMCYGRLTHQSHTSKINMAPYNKQHFQYNYPSPRQHLHSMNYQLGMPSSTYAQGVSLPSDFLNYNNSVPNTFQWRIPPGPTDELIHPPQNYDLWNANVILQKEELRYITGTIPLVQEDDKPLITDYFIHIMKQLRICNFMEKDRATRGGKRTNIKVGYGGLECIHCSLTNSPRKFFWSDVNRLSNSFAEIPTHVLRCSSCPEVVKKALLTLKEFHPTQMAEKQRGSQKTYLRRVWKRIHGKDESIASVHQGGQMQSSPESAIPGLDSIDSSASDSPDNGVPNVNKTTMGANRSPGGEEAVVKNSNYATPETNKLPALPEPRML